MDVARLDYKPIALSMTAATIPSPAQAALGHAPGTQQLVPVFSRHSGRRINSSRGSSTYTNISRPSEVNSSYVHGSTLTKDQRAIRRCRKENS